jgi:ornithine--oxo-acid transaminase
MSVTSAIEPIKPHSQTQEYMEREGRVCAPNYAPLPVVLQRGQGVWLYDIDGRRYLDMMSAYSAVSHGHSHPRLLKVLKTQAAKLTVCSRAFYHDQLASFLGKLCELTGLDMALPMNTGAEAVETAIKAVRRWGYRVKGIPADQAEIIVTAGNFHGRTSTIISFSSESEYRQDFGPFSPGFKAVPFGDAAALEASITPYTCAFLTEPMQGEAGIKIPPFGWLKAVEEICRQHQVLLILDEVQTGLGRTGKLFAYQHEDVRPDGVIVGKALGGGILPVSAFVARRDVLELMTPGSHGSTFGGNPLAAAIACEALQILIEDHYAERSAELGAYLLQQLQQLNSPLIREIRGKGLWIGIEFADVDPKIVSARLVCEQLCKRGILTKETHQTVVRLAPPLIIRRDELDWALERIQDVLHALEKKI